MLDARVLEGEGFISHPTGLDWYHSHSHGISSDQVMGGMSGLLSVGEATANVKAACQEYPSDTSKCLNDVQKDTDYLRNHTQVRYAILRDLPLQNISKRPDEPGDGTASWDPSARDFPTDTRPQCGAWKKDGSGLDYQDASIRTGFCQTDATHAWLFTLNGQRFPTITVEGGQNLLLRLGNLGANVAYWLELDNQANGTPLLLPMLSLDGVVPARPVVVAQSKRPAEITYLSNVLLMPASRAEIYVRNDEAAHTTPLVYVLRTKGVDAGVDSWPEIQLARIVLKPNTVTSAAKVTLNLPQENISTLLEAQEFINGKENPLPIGCVRDLDSDFREYRRVSFLDGGLTTQGEQTIWSIKTEIVRPPTRPGFFKGLAAFVGPEAKPELLSENKLNAKDPDETVGPYPFEEYEQADGNVDWTKHHVCIQIDHKGSHKQLWVLRNTTGALHNFHIHQMKFRLATTEELECHGIVPPTPSHTCDPSAGACTQPDYKYYEDHGISAANAKTAPLSCDNPDHELVEKRASSTNDSGANLLWHDTIPLPPFSEVFIVMSFDAQQQLGRFVFHCHILKHEDKGLMAPIEVWQAFSGPS
jgi:FtsP/CotA-like multicopper oxidase with cupredoxin domain